MPREAGEFLHEKNPNLHKTPEVELTANYLRSGGDRIPNQPVDKVAAHLGFLADPDYVNDGILTGDPASVDRQVDAQLVNPEDVPESYFRNQFQLAHELGHITYGEIEWFLSGLKQKPELRDQLLDVHRADQRASLMRWAEYLQNDDASYPDWFKYYVWNSVIRLGVYDKEKGEFGKRSKGSVSIYPELNREALAYVYDSLNKAKIENKVIDDPDLQQLLDRADFAKLYEYAMKNSVAINPENLTRTDGSWKKFEQTDEKAPALDLARSLQGYGTGWCTAGESTANKQLSTGDFYVYYSKDEDGNDSVPRLAIRIAKGEVAEARGIEVGQEVEANMADILNRKLGELPGGLEGTRRIEDMKRLTALQKLLAADPSAQLSPSEVRFLYELDYEIITPSLRHDGRVEALCASRGELDAGELHKQIPEAIAEQSRTAYAAYVEVCSQLGTEQLSTTEFEEIFTAKDSEWRTNGVYGYVADQIVRSGSRYKLVVTPAVQVDEQQIVNLAKAFCKPDGRPGYIDEEMYLRGRYTPQELTGDFGGQKVRLALVPSSSEKRLELATGALQRLELAAMQQERPGLHLRVPSVLEGLSYWYTLRARGEDLDLLPSIRHFDMEPQLIEAYTNDIGEEIDDEIVVPLSYAYQDRIILATGYEGEDEDGVLHSACIAVG